MGRIGRIIGVVCLLLCQVFALLAQRSIERNLYCAEEDRLIFERYLVWIEPYRSLSIDELLIHTALFFQETPYVASTLEIEPEGLVVNLRELDCATFAETALALSRTIQGGNPTFASFCDQLQFIRYREGVIRNYTDRLHYMADWFYENERKGIVRDIADEIGGSPLPLELSFISTHPDSYKPLRNQPEMIGIMAEKEREINRRPHTYLPKDDMDRLASGIKSGDILCFVTTIQGLDVTHVGIAYWLEGKLTFIHASSSAKKVVIQASSLREYMEGVRSCKGLLVARPQPLI